ncbi:hypothetical protein [Nostoc sp.]|uniref:hypothetical protein n=1 Tax=Nostoc sp. TaxID=1180 RepID=UPI003FA52DB0
MVSDVCDGLFGVAKCLRYMRSEEIGVRLITFLNNWVMSRKLGHITGSSADFILPSIEKDDSEKRNLRSPDVSFVRADLNKALSQMKSRI